MGMELIGPGHIVVTQMAEFTEIIDTDQDDWLIATITSSRILVSAEITTRPMPSVTMVMEVFTP